MFNTYVLLKCYAHMIAYVIYLKELFHIIMEAKPPSYHGNQGSQMT